MANRAQIRMVKGYQMGEADGNGNRRICQYFQRDAAKMAQMGTKAGRMDGLALSGRWVSRPSKS
jgi:hypothetical protein